MDIVFASSAVDCGFEPTSGQRQRLIELVCAASLFSIKEKEQRMIDSNQDNLSEWSDMSARNKARITIISLKCNLFPP